jgi:FKBP-type peptidyl-prolyl cis-trans isomerase (trigger factor)
MDTTTNPQAITETLELNPKKAEVEPALQTYWNKHKGKLPPALIRQATKGGYREPPRNRVVKLAGGLAVFYQPVFAQLIRDHLKAQKKSVLLIEFVEAEEGVDCYRLRTTFYPEPTVTWKQGSPPGINAPLTIKMPKHPDQIRQDWIDYQLNQLREQAVVLQPEPDDTALQADMVVSLDAKSTLDETVWAPGTFENNKWLMRPETFRLPEMYGALLGMKKGESKTIQITLNDQFTEEVRGKVSTILLTVNQVYKREMPDDLELAKTNGTDTFADLVTKVTGQVTEAWKPTRDEMILQGCLAELCKPELVTVDPLPFPWLIQKAQDLYLHYLKRAKSEIELIEHFQEQVGSKDQIKDKRSLLAFLAGQIARQFIFDLLIKSWGKAKNIPGGDDLESLSDYVQSVKQVLCDSVTTEATN